MMNGLSVRDVKLLDLQEHIIAEYVNDAYEEWITIVLG